MNRLMVEKKDLPVFLQNYIRQNAVNVIFMEEGETVTIGNQQWCEGNKTSYYITTNDGITLEPYYEPAGKYVMKKRFILIEKVIFAGKDLPPYVYAIKSDLPLRPPEKIELSKGQQIVLKLISRYNSMGRKDWRSRNRVSKEKWDSIVAELTGLRLTKRNGAITVLGRNIISTYPEHKEIW